MVQTKFINDVSGQYTQIDLYATQHLIITHSFGTMDPWTILYHSSSNLDVVVVKFEVHNHKLHTNIFSLGVALGQTLTTCNI